MTDPLTIYKLMILYMLKQVAFPLTNTQMLNYFLDREYTNYFTLLVMSLQNPEAKLYPFSLII